MKEKEKIKVWRILYLATFIIGLILLFHGMEKRSDRFGNSYKNPIPFRAEYFYSGLAILVCVYIIRYFLIKENEDFQPKNLDEKTISQKIKNDKIFGNVNLKEATFEDFTFAFGDNQNEYINIFYNHHEIELVRTKITAKCDGDFPTTVTAMTNIDKEILKEIFQTKHTSALVYFDKYHPVNYYFDLGFLVDLNLK
jgi:hypothetical protein